MADRLLFAGRVALVTGAGAGMSSLCEELVHLRCYWSLYINLCPKIFVYHIKRKHLLPVFLPDETEVPQTQAFRLWKQARTALVVVPFPRHNPQKLFRGPGGRVTTIPVWNIRFFRRFILTPHILLQFMNFESWQTKPRPTCLFVLSVCESVLSRTLSWCLRLIRWVSVPSISTFSWQCLRRGSCIQVPGEEGGGEFEHIWQDKTARLLRGGMQKVQAKKPYLAVRPLRFLNIRSIVTLMRPNPDSPGIRPRVWTGRSDKVPIDVAPNLQHNSQLNTCSLLSRQLRNVMAHVEPDDTASNQRHNSLDKTWKPFWGQVSNELHWILVLVGSCVACCG